MNLFLSENFCFSDSEKYIKLETKQPLSIDVLNCILSTLQIEKIKTINEYFKNVISSLNKNNINWNLYLAKNKKNEYMQYLEKRVDENKKYINQYFFDTFPKRLSLFKKLTTFNSEYDLPNYTHNSVTGRLSINRGTNFLIMKKTLRNKLVHKDNSRQLFELDFNSCEPNFYARYFSLIPNDVKDIYRYILSVIEEDIPRDKMKRIILSSIYGANEKSLSKITNIPVGKIKKIKEILDINNFEEKLKKEFKEKGFIENAYGRPIISNNNLVNYWIQSSAVDFCCLAFLNFAKSNNDIEIHAVIHDAIIFSTSKNNLTTCNTRELKVRNISIPLKINKIQLDN